MRIDEFSAPTNIDGSLSTEEITRFLLVGFDITINVISYMKEILHLNSSIDTSINEDSTVTKIVVLNSTIDLEETT